VLVDLDGFEFDSEVGSGQVFKLTDLENWYSSAPVRVTVDPLPLSDGGFAPNRTYRSPKVMSINGFCYGGTTMEAIENAWQRIAAIAPDGEAMTLTVTDDSSDVKSMRVWLNGNPQVLPFRNNAARFQIPIVASDPRKYGPVQTALSQPPGTSSTVGLAFPLFAPGYLDFGVFAPAGLFYISNDGTAETWPTFTVLGVVGVEGFQILSNEQTIEYAAAVPSGSQVVLSPYAGGRASVGGVDVTSNLTQANWPSVKPGQTREYIFNPLGSTSATTLMTAQWSVAWW
jgi:hypothetical protein